MEQGREVEGHLQTRTSESRKRPIYTASTSPYSSSLESDGRIRANETPPPQKKKKKKRIKRERAKMLGAQLTQVQLIFSNRYTVFLQI